jgi:hypothetical protein
VGTALQTKDVGGAALRLASPLTVARSLLSPAHDCCIRACPSVVPELSLDLRRQKHLDRLSVSTILKKDTPDMA